MHLKVTTFQVHFSVYEKALRVEPDKTMEKVPQIPTPKPALGAPLIKPTNFRERKVFQSIRT